MQSEIETEVLKRDGLLTEIVRRLVEVYHPSSIYLFGSKARGDERADSDYDILVVVPVHTPAELLGSGRGYEALWSTGTATDVLVCTESYFNSRMAVNASLPSAVMHEGKLLYAA
jgi:uncharacterized protein